VQQVNELDDTTAFLEAELADFSTRTGTSKDDKPIKQRYYPKNPKIQKEINAKVDELLQMGVQMGFTEHSKSPYSSPIVVVKKKTGKWKLCVDFRQINAKSVKDACPMPRIKYILDQLREARYINSLDLKDGYWQIPLEHQTAFEEVKAKLAADPVLAARTSVELSPCKQTPATTQAIDYVSNTDRHRKWRKSNLLFEPNT